MPVGWGGKGNPTPGHLGITFWTRTEGSGDPHGRVHQGHASTAPTRAKPPAKGRQNGSQSAPPGILCQRSPFTHLPPPCWASWYFISHSAAAAVGLPGMDEPGEAGWGGSAGWENLERPLRGSGCRARSGTRRWRSREKKDSSFYSQAGVVGCLWARGCHYGRPRQPPGSSASPRKAVCPCCPQTTLLGQGAALGAGGEHGGLPWPGTLSRSAGTENSWKRGCPRPQLPGGFRLGVCSCQRQRWGWGGLRDACGGGGTPRAAEGLVVMTGNVWAQRGRWSRAGLWNTAGARRGGGKRQEWPGLELGDTRCPGCSEHPVELGAALQGHWESPAEGCGN